MSCSIADMRNLHSIEPHFRQYAKEFAGRSPLYGSISAPIYGPRSVSGSGERRLSIFLQRPAGIRYGGAVYPTLLKRMIEEGLKTGELCEKLHGDQL